MRTSVRTLAAVAAVGCVVVWSVSAAAQTKGGSRPTREFVMAAGQSDQFEIREAQAALGQSSDPAVRAYAQHMIADHGATSARLQSATGKAGLEPPPMGMSDDQARLLSALQSLSGPDFDREYWRHQALSHRSALTVQGGYAASGDTPEVRQAAAAAVPTITGHLQTAEQMRANAGG